MRAVPRCQRMSMAEHRPVIIRWQRVVMRSLSRLRMKLKSKGSPYSITKRRVPELIQVLGSQPAGDVSHKSGDRLPLLSARLAVTIATLKRAAANFAAL